MISSGELIAARLRSELWRGVIGCESHGPSVIEIKMNRSQCVMRTRGVQRNEETTAEYSKRERSFSRIYDEMCEVKSALQHFIPFKQIKKNSLEVTNKL